MQEKQLHNYIQYLREFVTPERWDTINRVLEGRTRYLAVVLEDIYQPHNASAVLRSCECFGVQDVHIIENKNEFDPDRGVTIGADQWLTLTGYDKTKVCYEALREEGYRIAATSPRDGGTPLNDYFPEQKTALVFGAELTGLSDYAVGRADDLVRIPIYGFSESYNISVSAALCLYQLTLNLRRKGDPADWGLSEVEKTALKVEWLEQSVRASDQLRQKFLDKQG